MLSNAGNLIGVETTYCNSMESNATHCDSAQLMLTTVDSSNKYTRYNMVSGGNGGQSLVRGDPLSTGGYFDPLSRPWWQAGVAAGRRPGSQLGNSAISDVYSSKTVSHPGSLMFSLVQPFFNSSNDLQGVFYVDRLLSTHEGHSQSPMDKMIRRSMPSETSELSVMDDQGERICLRLLFLAVLTVFAV